MKVIAKKVTSWLLMLAMFFTCVPETAITALAAETTDGIIQVEETYASRGGSVSVDISIKNNPGVLGMTLKVAYDESKLALTSVANGEAFSHMTFTAPKDLSSGCTLPWAAEYVEEEDIKDGVIATLTFNVLEGALENELVDIAVSYEEGSIIDNDLNPLNPDVKNGSIFVIDYIPGDTNGNKIVDTTDVVYLMRYIAGGYGVTINEAAADVNDDNNRNTTDVVYMMRYIAGGYGVELKPHTPRCSHTMQATAAKAATCTEEGNEAYWYCTSCEKYFSDEVGKNEIELADTVIVAKGHTEIEIPAVEPDYGKPGSTAGIMCAVCEETIKEPEEIPALIKGKYNIYYHIGEDDEYLYELYATDQIANENPASCEEGENVTLLNLVAPGYVFEGWYDGAGSSAEQIKKIENISENIHLYAKWSKIPYTVQFDAPLVPMAAQTFTVDTGLTLNAPAQLPGYVFMGWSDAEGNIVKQIPVGTAKNITLYGNWTSFRNHTRPVGELGDPVIHFDEERKQIFFAYEIGTIENIPLSELKYIGNLMEGVEITETVTKAVTVDESSAKEISEAVSNATTKTSSWTLSEEWNETTSISETHLDELTMEEQNNLSWGISENDTYNLGVSQERTTTTSVEMGISSKIGAKVGTEASIGIPIEAINVGAKVSTEISAEVGSNISSSRSDTSTWNTNEGYSKSKTASSEGSVSTSLAQKISESVTYDVSNSATTATSNSQSTGTTSTNSREYASTFTYSTAQMDETTYTVALKNAPAGYYRMVCAGTAHVFAVVTYDIATQSYGIFSYSIMEDAVRPFLDYSKESASFDDNENGVLPLDLPYFVNDYVASIVGASDGLLVDPDTGIIEGYVGTDDIVIVPQYMSVDDGDGEPTVVKVTGFAESAFSGNTSLKAVQFNKGITTIPDNAFAGCSSLVIVHAPYVTTIGANAFDGCTSLKEYVISEQVVSLGDSAFTGVNRITVTAKDVAVVDAAVNSGAKNISINLRGMSGTLDNKTYTIGSDTESFVLIGDGHSFNDLQIVSDATVATELINMTLTHSSAIPFECTSPSVMLNRVSISAPEYAVKLMAPSTRIGLYGTVNVASDSVHAMLTKNAEFYWYNPSASGKLVLDGNLLVSGTLAGESNVSFTDGKVIYIDMDNPATITFDANGGTVEEASRSVWGGMTVGALPVPTKEFNEFLGWYDAVEGGNLITESTLIPEDMTVYAHWEERIISDWVLESEMPENAELIEEKWTYTETLKAESTESTMEGYTQSGSYWNQIGEGQTNYATFPATFDSNNHYALTFTSYPYEAYENENTKREVENTWAGYIYWHWMYSVDYAYTLERTIADSPCSYAGLTYNLFYAYATAADAPAIGDHSYVANYQIGTAPQTYNGHGYVPAGTGLGTPRLFRFDYYLSTYTDYQKIYQYEKVTTGIESEVAVEESETISNVQRWVKYRAK